MPCRAGLDPPGILHYVMVLAGMGKGKDYMDFESRIWDCDAGFRYLPNVIGKLIKKVPRWPFNIGPKRWLLRSPFYGKGVFPWYSGWFCGARMTSGHWPFS